ncbi:MAG: HD domain-containing protein [Ktedonobacteraceae bacterium]|nr:HD domain-containing protein [Ktedonobacteraceae bacterium]
MLVRNSVSIETALWDAIEAIVSAMNARSNTHNHSVRVACYAVEIAKAASWPDWALAYIRLGALLHDIGQIYWPEELLQKSRTSLTNEERRIIESHTYKGGELVAQWSSLECVKPFILYHQEWIDGSGYPYGLHGDALPEEVQIVSLADVYEALRHPRSYKQRSGFSSQETIELMRTMRGKRWGVDLFDIFADIAAAW